MKRYSILVLSILCILGLERAVDLLIFRGSNASATNEFVYTPLHYAAISGKKIKSKIVLQPNEIQINLNLGETRIAELLLSNGSNPNATNREKETPLHLAAEKGNTIKLKSSCNQMNSKLICILGHEKVAELLISNSSSLFAKNEVGNTPLFLAASSGNKIK